MDSDGIHYRLLSKGIATEEEICLVTSINGTSEETYNAILYTRTGYRSFDQMDDNDIIDYEGMLKI